MAEPEILFEKHGLAGVITLNRPKALNAVTLNMVRLMHPKLSEWADDPDIAHVVVKAEGERAFSAGGDIRALHDWGRAGDPQILDFYREEYRLNTFIKHYPKPYVALIDGIVMGGGVGVSVNGSHRVGGEGIVFAMPETGIGLFPDVGGTWFLPHLPGKLGTYLALTGARLKQADALWAGVTTHAASSDALESLCEALTLSADIDSCFADHAIDPGAPPSAGLMDDIDRCFSGATVESILEALDADDSEWTQKSAVTIRPKSPTSLKIALRQMQVGANADFEECMRTEFRIVNRVIEGGEFYEGVRALIIDKDNDPKWNPATLAEVSDSDIDRYFADLGENELELP